MLKNILFIISGMLAAFALESLSGKVDISQVVFFKTTESTSIQTAQLSSEPSSSSQSEKTVLASSSSVDASRRNAIVQATQLVSPSVVSISVTHSQIVRYGNPYDPFFDFFGPRYRRKEISSLGSGVILDPKGYIVTNSHVIGSDRGEVIKIVVSLPDGRELQAKFIGEDPNNDLAVIKVKEKNLPVAKIQEKGENLIGEWVVAIGNPYGYLIDDSQPTVTVGVISALNRTFAPQSGIHYHNMIQTDASINPGNSGGALVNTMGEVIGINTFIFTGGSGSQGSIGLGFALPIQKAKRVVEELIRFGKIREFTTGIYTDPSLTEIMQGKAGIPVAGVDPGSPGDKAGLKAGDIIVSVAGRKVRTLYDAKDIFQLFQVGETVELGVIRNDKNIVVLMKLEEKKG